MKKLTVICMTLMAMIFAVSCRGPMGPEGPEGPMGNANVYSSTITVRSSDWYFDNNTSWRVDLRYEAITADIAEHGAVLVYMEDRNTWRQIPLTFYYNLFDDDGNEYFYSSSLEVSSYENGVSIFWTEDDFFDGYRPEDHRFKIVVIAASVYASRPDVDYSDYEAVKRAFQLVER